MLTFLVLCTCSKNTRYKMKQIFIQLWSKMTNPQSIYDTFYPFMIFSKTCFYFHSTPVGPDVIVTRSDKIRFCLSIIFGLMILCVIAFVPLPIALDDKIFFYGSYLLLFSACFTCLLAIIILMLKRKESHMVLNDINELCLKLQKMNIRLSYKLLQTFGYVLGVFICVLFFIGGVIFQFTIGPTGNWYYLLITWPATIYLQMLVHFLMCVNTINTVYEEINEALWALNDVSDKMAVLKEVQQIKRMHQLINKAIRNLNASLSLVVQPAFALIPFFLIYCSYVCVRIMLQAKFDKLNIIIRYTYDETFFIIFFFLISHYGNKTGQCKDTLLKFVQEMLMTHYDNSHITQALIHFRYQIQQEKSQIQFFTVPYDYTYLYTVIFFLNRAFRRNLMNLLLFLQIIGFVIHETMILMQIQK